MTDTPQAAGPIVFERYGVKATLMVRRSAPNGGETLTLADGADLLCFDLVHASQLADVTTKLREAERELRGLELGFHQLDEWLHSQTEFFCQNPQVNRTFLEVSAKLRELRQMQIVESDQRQPVASEAAEHPEWRKTVERALRRVDDQVAAAEPEATVADDEGARLKERGRKGEKERGGR